jgi:hypothetical protein
MPDIEPLLRDRFAAYRADLGPLIEAAGPDVARRTVQRRRRIAAAAAAALAVALIAAPIAAIAAYDRDAAPVVPAETGKPTPTPAPTTTTTPTATATASASSPPSSPPAAPDGRITRAQLLAARVDLPPWPSLVPPSCAVNDVRLRAAPTPDSVPVLLDLAYGDVDDDGADETLARVECRIGEATAKQAVVFDRTRAGRITTLGQVTRTHEGFDDITGMVVDDEGDVRLQVADIQPCCGTPRYWAQKQWRTYRWGGERFRQIAGPTGFGPHPRATDLRIPSAKFTLGAPDASGRRHGDLTVTISNEGPKDVAFLGVGFGDLGYPKDVGAGSTCTASTFDGYCLVPGLSAGDRRTITFGFSLPQSGLPASGTVQVDHYDADHLLWPDLAGEDNHVEFQVG